MAQQTRLFVTPEQVALLEAVLRFANLRPIRSTGQVEGLFERVPGVGPRFRILKPAEAPQYAVDQEELRAWLRAIADGRGAEIASKVSVRLGALDSLVRFDPQRQELQAVYFVQGVQGAYALATALLLAPSTHLAARLGYCDAPQCHRFRLDLERRRGRPWRYCSAPHREAADRAHAAANYAERRRRTALALTRRTR